MTTLKRWLTARYVLATAAVLFIAAAVTVHVWKAGTSVSVVSATPSSPAKTTTVHATGSDTFQLGLLGFAAVFILATVFYGRLSQITLPGGIGIKLNPEQKQQASEALARQAQARAAQPAAQAAAPGQVKQVLVKQPRILQLPVMAAASAAGDHQQVLQATHDTVKDAALAAQRTADYAETLLRLARTSPDACRTMAEALDIPPQDWSQMLTGVITPEAWDRLAKRALDEVSSPNGPPTPPGRGLPPGQG
jgi:hypothetical protein